MEVPNSLARAVLWFDAGVTLHATRREHLTARFALDASDASAWLVKTRRAPSRRSRDARVYGHATTAMHKLSTPPLPVEEGDMAKKHFNGLGPSLGGNLH